MNEFDYIIIGSGTAGSVHDRRLTENQETRVLVLEAGGDWIPATVDAAPLWPALLGSDVDWGYQTVPQPGLGGRVIHEPRGKMPGGSSSMSKWRGWHNQALALYVTSTITKSIAMPSM